MTVHPEPWNEMKGLVEGVYLPAPLAFYPGIRGNGHDAGRRERQRPHTDGADGGWVADGPYCAP